MKIDAFFENARLLYKEMQIVPLLYVLENGNRVMIKRKLFEEYLNRASVI